MTPSQQPPTIHFDPQFRRMLLTIGYMLIAAGFAYAFAAAWPVVRAILSTLAPFIVALVVAYLFNPIVNVAERRLRITRLGGVLVVNLLIFLVAGIFVAIVVPILSTQIKSAYDGVRDTSTEKVIPWINRKVMGDERPLETSTVDFLRDRLAADMADPAGTVPRSALGERLAHWKENGTAGPGETERAAAQMESWLATQPDPVPVEAMVAKLDMLRADAERGIASWAVLQYRVLAFLEERHIDVGDLADRALRSTDLRSAATSAASEGAGLLGRVVFWVVAVAMGLVGKTMFVVFVFLVSFYLLIDFAALRGVAEVMVPQRHQARFFDVARKVDVAVGGFIRGQITSALLVGLLTFVGLMVLGLKQYALLIGCIATVGNLIPYLGPVMGATPAVLYMLLADGRGDLQDRLISAGLVVGLFGAIQAIDGFVFQPKIVGKGAQLHPVAVMMALVLGAHFGVVGMIVAVPLACIARVIAKEFYWDARENAWHERTGKARLDETDTPKPQRKKKARKAE